MTLAELPLPIESLIRLAAFVGVLFLLMLAELWRPRRQLSVSKPKRWFDNIGLALFNSCLTRLLIPITLFSFALVMEDNRWGLLNVAELPQALQFLIVLPVMDFVIYWQHRLFHSVSWLWKLHRVHHCDVDFDLTTAVRFHPVEMLLSLFIKMLTVALLGAPAELVLIFELVLSLAALFNHSNFSLPKWLDAVLRRVIVTPDMHRVHHSVIPSEMNSNFGFNFSWWDRIFHTYQDQPVLGHKNMEIGLEHQQPSQQPSFVGLLMLPFLGASGS